MICTGRWPCSLIFYLSPAISIMIVFNFAHMRFDLISVAFHHAARRYARTLFPFNVHIFPLQFDRKSNGNPFHFNHCRLTQNRKIRFDAVAVWLFLFKFETHPWPIVSRQTIAMRKLHGIRVVTHTPFAVHRLCIPYV